MGSLSALSQKADCCVLSGLQPFWCEKPVPLPSSHCWAQWLFPHLVKGILHVQAGLLIRKVPHSLEVPLLILCLLDFSSFEAGEGNRALLPPSTCIPTPHTHTHTHILLGVVPGVCVVAWRAFSLGSQASDPFLFKDQDSDAVSLGEKKISITFFFF